MELDSAAIYARRWWALAVMCLSLLVIGIDNTVLNVAIPSLIKDLGATTSQLQWIVDGYTLVFAGLLLTAGSLGDRFGRKGALTIGLAIFTVGSRRVRVRRSSANMLIFTRAFMGIGGALDHAGHLVAADQRLPRPAERGRAIGVWAAVAGVERRHRSDHRRHPARALRVGLGVPHQRPHRHRRASSRAASCSRRRATRMRRASTRSAPCSRSPAWSRSSGRSSKRRCKGWTSAPVRPRSSAASSCSSSFVCGSCTADHPMLDVRFFENRRFTAANVAITLTFFALFGAGFLFTQYLQNVLGYSPLQAGVLLLPQALLLLVVAPISPRLAERFGTKLVVGTGC